MAGNSVSRYLTQLNTQLGHVDFDSVSVAYGITRMSVGVQRTMGDLTLHLINAWAKEADLVGPTHPLRSLYELSAKAVSGMNENPATRVCPECNEVGTDCTCPED